MTYMLKCNDQAVLHSIHRFKGNLKKKKVLMNLRSWTLQLLIWDIQQFYEIS